MTSHDIRTRRLGVVAAAAITILAALAPGCSLVRGEPFETLVESMPELAERPVTVTIPREPGGRKVALEDLALDCGETCGEGMMERIMRGMDRIADLGAGTVQDGPRGP